MEGVQGSSDGSEALAPGKEDRGEALSPERQREREADGPGRLLAPAPRRQRQEVRRLDLGQADDQCRADLHGEAESTARCREQQPRRHPEREPVQVRGVAEHLSGRRRDEDRHERDGASQRDGGCHVARQHEHRTGHEPRHHQRGGCHALRPLLDRKPYDDVGGEPWNQMEVPVVRREGVRERRSTYGLLQKDQTVLGPQRAA